MADPEPRRRCYIRLGLAVDGDEQFWPIGVLSTTIAGRADLMLTGDEDPLVWLTESTRILSGLGRSWAWCRAELYQRGTSSIIQGTTRVCFETAA